MTMKMPAMMIAMRKTTTITITKIDIATMPTLATRMRHTRKHRLELTIEAKEESHPRNKKGLPSQEATLQSSWNSQAMETAEEVEEGGVTATEIVDTEEIGTVTEATTAEIAIEIEAMAVEEVAISQISNSLATRVSFS